MDGGGAKTASYTAVCGFSHILGTIIIGLLVFLLGLAFSVSKRSNRFVGISPGGFFFVWCILFCLGCEMGYPQKKDGTRC